MDLTAQLAFPLLEIFKVISVVFIPGKNQLPVITPLDDVIWHIVRLKTGVSRHVKNIRIAGESQKINPPFAYRIVAKKPLLTIANWTKKAAEKCAGAHSAGFSAQTPAF